MCDYRTCCFHILIITLFSLLLLAGCGFKTDPYWVEKKEKVGMKL
jgi:hypothetical protein